MRSRMNKTLKKTMGVYKLSVQIWRIFFLMTVIFLGILTTSGYFVYGIGVFQLNKYYITFAVVFSISTLCMILSGFAAYYLIRKIFVPLEELSEASKQVAKGEFNVHVEYNGILEELQNTIENFNLMVKELNSVEMMRNDFIADVSHEFKTPLAAITGYTAFLQDEELSLEEKDVYIRKIFFNVDKMNELTENILHLSKIEHQQFLKKPMEYRLDEQIREAIVWLEPKWEKKKTNLELELPEVIYRGQKSLLFHVWINIIGNAVKYTEEGGTIEVSLKEMAKHCEIIIKDNGIGMTEETKKHIFEKFYQADTSRKVQGNGLGLALCKEIIQKCEGRIMVESKLGEGSIFFIQLPKE